MHPLTVTHARIRAAQGDVEGARRILGAILAERPEHAAARELLAALADRTGAARDDQPPAALAPPVAGDVRHLAARFRRSLGRAAEPPSGARIRRLRRWLARVAPRGPGRRARSE